MKVISLTQPWASLVASGEKRIETRSWERPYRGPLAIHSSKGFQRWAKETCLTRFFYESLQRMGFSVGTLPLGKIIATCELVAIKKIDKYDWKQGQQAWSYGGKYWEATPQEKAFGDYAVGRFMWFLDNVKPLPKPIPAKGMLGLWEFDLTLGG